MGPTHPGSGCWALACHSGAAAERTWSCVLAHAALHVKDQALRRGSLVILALQQTETKAEQVDPRAGSHPVIGPVLLSAMPSIQP